MKGYELSPEATDNLQEIWVYIANDNQAHFQRNPLGRGQLAVFPRCSLDPYDSDMGALPPVRLGPP
jgi:hypothetical protein